GKPLPFILFEGRRMAKRTWRAPGTGSSNPPSGVLQRRRRESSGRTQHRENKSMCRNIKTLFNFDPPATEEEIQAAALQFVRKLSGFNKPSKVNEAAFHRAVERVAAVARSLLGSLVTSAEPRDRDVEAQRARARAAQRFGT